MALKQIYFPNLPSLFSQDLFDLDFEEHPHLKDIVHHYFFERFKGYRYRCHKKYQELIKESKDPLQHLPNQYIKSADWEWMCINCFGNEEWQVNKQLN